MTKCQMPHSCFARVLECSAVETQELYVPITHSLLLFDLALPSSSASTARNIRIDAVRAPFIWIYHKHSVFLWEILKTWTLRDKVTEINGFRLQMKYTTFCASGDYPNRMSGWLEVSFGADQGGKDRFCQLRQRVVDAHVFAYRGICARCTMASRINTR